MSGHVGGGNVGTCRYTYIYMYIYAYRLFVNHVTRTTKVGLHVINISGFDGI